MKVFRISYAHESLLMTVSTDELPFLITRRLDFNEDLKNFNLKAFD